MEETDDHPPQQQPPPSSSLPSHDAVCKSLFSLYRGKPIYQLFSMFYSTMVEQCPQSGMEEIQKAVKEGNKREAFNIMNRLFEAHAASGDLHRINALIYAQHLAESDNPSDREKNLKMGLTSAARSVQLSPLNIDNRFILLNYYSQLARDPKDQQLIIKHCKTALMIKEHHDKGDPRSPASSRSKIINILHRERQQRIDSFWRPMLNKHYTLVSITDLHAFVKNESEREVIQEAWNFGASHPSWKFWMCCSCNQKFDRSSLLFKHFADAHLTPHAISIICSGALEHGNPSTSLERFPVKERISVDAASSQLIVAVRCLFNIGTDTSQTAFPSRDLSITANSYQSRLYQWIECRDTRRRQGARLPLVLEKMPQKEAGVITGISDLKITDDAQGTGAIEKALERLSADMDWEIKNNDAWIFPAEKGTEDLPITENPFGGYDYRNVLLPLRRSYIWACVEEQADIEQDTMEAVGRSKQKKRHGSDLNLNKMSKMKRSKSC